MTSPLADKRLPVHALRGWGAQGSADGAAQSSARETTQERYASWPVSRVLCRPLSPRRWPFLWDACCQAPHATYPDGDAESIRPGCPSPLCRPYLVLLPVGFAVPPLLPAARCALTAPFHPYCIARRLPPGAAKANNKAVCFLLHFPWVTPAGRYPAPCFRGARTFLHSKSASTANGHSALLKQRPPGQLALHLMAFRSVPSRALTGVQASFFARTIMPASTTSTPSAKACSMSPPSRNAPASSMLTKPWQKAVNALAAERAASASPSRP